MPAPQTFSLFSGTSIHGIYALCYLSRQPVGSVCSSAVIADALGVRQDVALKLLQRLSGAGLITSVCGRRGGYMLPRSLEDISLIEVLDALNPKEDEDRLRPRSCTGEPSQMCGAHRGLLRLNARVRSALGKETLAILVGSLCIYEDAPAGSHFICKSEKENQHAVTVS